MVSGTGINKGEEVGSEAARGICHLKQHIDSPVSGDTISLHIFLELQLLSLPCWMDQRNPWIKFV